MNTKNTKKYLHLSLDDHIEISEKNITSARLWANLAVAFLFVIFDSTCIFLLTLKRKIDRL
jgi:hypothetical protein